MTPVKSATPVDNDDTSGKYPHLSRALGDEDGYFDPTDPSDESSSRFVAPPSCPLVVPAGF